MVMLYIWYENYITRNMRVASKRALRFLAPY